jgi:hypothetical protein
VLLGPQIDQELGQPATQREQPVNASMAGGADCDQQIGGVHAWPAVVHVKKTCLHPRPAPSTTLISDQDGFAVSIKARSGVGASAVAARAQAGDGRNALPAITKQAPLARGQVSSIPRDESAGGGKR